MAGLTLLSACHETALLVNDQSKASVNGAETSASQGLGLLAVRILWPNRDLPGFQMQVIPTRTTTLRLRVLNSGGERVAERLIPRLIASPAGSASIALLAATGYTIVADAFQENIPTETSTPIAAGTAANIFIRKSKTTSVPITLTAAYAPAITSLSVSEGPYATDVVITGKNFGYSQNLPFSVTFAGTRASATRTSESQIVTAVPSGAVSGNVVVTVDNVPSTSVSLFAVVQGLDTTVDSWEDSFKDTGLDVGVDSGSTEHGFDLDIR